MSSSRSPEVYLNEPWLVIRWDHEHGCIYAEFKSFAGSADFRQGVEKILEAIRDRRAASLVSDNRRLEGVTNQDQQWIRDFWTPLAVASGLKRIGVVLADQGPGRIASEEIIGQFEENVFATRTFDSPDDALNWVSAAG